MKSETKRKWVYVIFCGIVMSYSNALIYGKAITEKEIISKKPMVLPSVFYLPKKF